MGRMPRGGAEESQFTALLEAIREVRLSDSSDGWIWGLDHSGFSVASARKYIDEQVLTGGYTTTRWPRCVPIKVNVFMWRLGLNKLPTLANMDRKVLLAYLIDKDHMSWEYQFGCSLWLDIVAIFELRQTLYIGVPFTRST
ncbi:RNA-directed DNA polymerase, eukaryota [Artemisia annua]|uniref:RNA-directed DNA polymerase, eukaryota n=1 Tax=Artemisia annua TaxID=35608 RepID=A0A2U1L1X5_ARTAN|nr:RNA-directed DNA polymerase, eukaryota [Artemisia annua]